jgi:hypothetical protein
MAFRHGKNAALTIATKDISAFMDSMDLNFDLDTADTTAFGATWKTAIGGVPSGTMALSGFYDPTATTGPGAVLVPLLLAGTLTTALVYPGGTASGQSLYTITSGAIVTSYSESSPVGGVVSWKANVQIVILPVRTVI